ncbi:MAG TPA: FUSC family protein [Silvibacterium sp.]|nr:FUSC family protein [Silvibacterium sp.]
MAAASTISRPGLLVWLRTFLRDELAPYPGRGALVARMVVAASIVMLVNMTFKIPYGAYATLYALTTSRENPDSTLKAVKTSVLWFAIAAAYVLIGAILFSSDPVLRVVWVLASLFLIFFSLSAAANHLAAVRFGYLVAITLTLWDSEIRAEEKVVGTLWAIGSFSFAHLIIATVEFIFVRLQPTDQIKNAIVDRLQSVAALLRSLSAGVKNDGVEKRVTRLAILGTSRMRRDLRRSDYSSEMNQQEGALIALVGRLVDLGASVAVLSSEHSNEVRRWYHEFADRVDVLTDLILGERTSLEQELPLESPPPGTAPLLLEMERTVAVTHEILSGSGLQGGYQHPPIRPEPARRFFVPDAFSNPEHVRFGIRGGLAASLCYLIYNLVAWPGISTAITTCLLTALTTVGASRQKQLLRFAGALVGGVILGFGTQMFVLPGIESISGFLILFLIVTIPAAWIASSGPRLSYFGVQIALAFYLMNLQEFKFQISLAVARDRLAGILLGLVAMWFVFDQLWEASAAVEMERTFVSTIRLLGRMMRAPTSLDPAAAIGEIDSLRESVNANFDRLRQHADGVMLELGSSRERNLTMRAQLLGWQLQLRMLFISRVALLKYRMRFPGFEVPEQILQAQRAFDIHVAERLDEMANRLTGNDVAMQRGLEPLLLPLETSIHEMCPSESPDCLPAVRSLLPLCRKVDSILSFLEEDIFSA